MTFFVIFMYLYLLSFRATTHLIIENVGLRIVEKPIVDIQSHISDCNITTDCLGQEGFNRIGAKELKLVYNF